MLFRPSNSDSIKEIIIGTANTTPPQKQQKVPHFLFSMRARKKFLVAEAGDLFLSFFLVRATSFSSVSFFLFFFSHFGLCLQPPPPLWYEGKKEVSERESQRRFFMTVRREEGGGRGKGEGERGRGRGGRERVESAKKKRGERERKKEG